MNPIDPNPPLAPWKALERLPDGPLDILGDIHGELDALRQLLVLLGHSEDGDRPIGRRLVFVGDLIDRGPDSPGVVHLVRRLIESGKASAVMGNHELNAITGKPQKENTWFLGHGPVSPFEQAVASETERDAISRFLASFPLALERADLRVVHAAWDSSSLQKLSQARHPAEALAAYKAQIAATFHAAMDPVDRKLALQNNNPVKVLTSGPEERARAPFFAGGKMRNEARRAWWDSYHESPFVVFGHYWRISVPALNREDGLFNAYPLQGVLGAGQAMCIDYSVGSRFVQRQAPNPTGRFLGRLAALRWPERELVFDDGERLPLLDPQKVRA